jgi:hypothetical protein
MATVEIAKIQVRRGLANVDGVPQLDSGEMGWAIDTQELYVGAGSLEEGAPTEGNIRILTQYDKPEFFNITTGTYIYKNDSVIPIYTDPSGQTDTQLTVQKKLDSFTSMVDFGVSPGDPVYASQGIQNAINQLYLNLDKNTSNPASKAILKIPAGKYAITSTIYVPPNVTIVGDGQNNTILSMVSTGTTLFQFCDLSSVAGSPVVFVPGSNNITSSGRPVNINLREMTLQYDSSISNTDQTLPLVRADCVESASFIDMGFRGTTATNTSSYAAIEIRGQGAITTENLVVDRVDFSYLGRAIISDYDINDLSISKSSFKNLGRAISFLENTVINNETGPVNVKIDDSIFKDINQQAIFIGTNTNGASTLFSSHRNSYMNVGNNGAGDLLAATAVIELNTLGNSSVDDRFSRQSVINSTSTAATFLATVAGAATVLNNSTQATTLSATTATLVKFGYAGSDQQIELRYQLRKPVAQISRRGLVRITVNSAGLVTVSDTFTYTGSSDGSLTFTANFVTATNTISVMYTSPDADGSLEYQYNIYQ